MIHTKVDGININMIILSNGLANNFRTISYDKELIRINDGRGFLDSLFFLDRLKIRYSLSSIHQLKKDEQDLGSYIVLMPKSVLERNSKPKIHVRHLFPFYSAFAIRHIDDNIIILEVAGEGIEEKKVFEITWEDFNYYSTLYTLPLEQPVYLVKLARQTLRLKEEEILFLLNETVSRFLVDKNRVYENTQCSSGPQFYSFFLEQLQDYANDVGQVFTKKDYLKQYIFAASMNSGSIGFYRQDFAAALKNSFIAKNVDLDMCVQNLAICGNGWREVGRSIRFYQNSRKCFDQALFRQISEIMADISEKEISSMNDLEDKLKKGWYQ
jgi:hypothetical protein